MAAIDSATKNSNNDVIDLCHDSNDELIPNSFSTESTASTTSITNVSTLSSSTNASDQINPNKIFDPAKHKWSTFFYGSEDKAPEPIHPLLQHHIARANVLEAMMNAANDRDTSNHTTNGSNNNSNEPCDKVTFQQKELLNEHEGSSSDCIVIEDTGSEPFPFGTGGASGVAIEQNGQKKDSVDRDSGVDVGNSIKSTTDEVEVAPAKRPRGRPRKDGTPAGSAK